MLTLDQQYAIAQAPGPGPTGGLKLRQAAVGHFMLLSRLESPLVSDPRNMKAGDLALALWVLGRPWRKAERNVGNYTTRMWIRYDVRVFKDDANTYLSKLCDLLNYWKYHTTGLKCWERNGGKNTLPAVFSMQYALNQLGYTASQSLDHPLKGALAALTAMNAMSNPDSALMDEDVLGYMDDVRRRRRERLAKQKEES